MTADDRPEQSDFFGFGDVTAGSVVTGSILPGGSATGAEDAGARIRAAEADRRASMIRVAEQAAEIGLESAPALAAAAGLAPRPAPRPAPLTGSPPSGRTPNGRITPTGQRLAVPPRPGPPVAPTRRRVNPVVVVLVVLVVAYLVVRAVAG